MKERGRKRIKERANPRPQQWPLQSGGLWLPLTDVLDACRTDGGGPGELGRAGPLPPGGGRGPRCPRAPPVAAGRARTSFSTHAGKKDFRGVRDAGDAGEGRGSAEKRPSLPPGRREGAVDRPPAVRYPPRLGPGGERDPSPSLPTPAAS